MSKICPKCGHENAEEANFCNYCAEPLRRVEQPPVAPSREPEQEEREQREPEQQPMAQEELEQPVT